MELEELKTVWAQYDKKLTQNLKFNEEILRKMNLDNSKKAMNAPLVYEIINTGTSAPLLIYLISATYRLAGDIKFLVPGLISIVTFSIYLYLSINKIKLLSNIDFYNSPILELQKSVNNFKQRYLRYKKYELYCFPVFVITSMPILAIALRGFNFYDHPTRFTIAITLSILLYYPLAFWFYKNTFDKKISNTNTFLEELLKYEKVDWLWGR